MRLVDFVFEWGRHSSAGSFVDRFGVGVALAACRSYGVFHVGAPAQFVAGWRVSRLTLPIWPTIVFRGSTWAGRHGLSWTADPGHAASYRDDTHPHGAPGDRMIWTAEVPASRILGAISWVHLDGRESTEFLVDVGGLPVRLADNADYVAWFVRSGVTAGLSSAELDGLL